MSFLDQEPIPCVINGKAVQTKKTFDLIDPHDASAEPKVIYKVAGAGMEDVDAAVDAAWAAFPAWSATDYAQRRAILLKAAQLVRDRVNDLIAIETRETTSAETWAGFTIGKLSPESIEETACCLTSLRGEIVPSPAGQTTYIERKPYGVVVGIAPWNAPLVLGIRAVRDAIAAGNTTILKTSEHSPKIHLAIAQIFKEAGLPDGVLNVLHIATPDAPKLIEHLISRKEVRKVNFTGSTFVGAKIAEMCGRHLKPTVMELGGKAPLVIMPSANLEMAASAAIFGGLLHSGQICMSTDLLLVHESISDKFAGILNEEFKKYSADPKSGFLRGLFAMKSADRLNGAIEDALQKGAKVVAGKHGREHNVIQPLVLGNIKDDMRAASEEAFGPVMHLRNFSSEEEAIKLANASDYASQSPISAFFVPYLSSQGLAASVYSNDIEEAMRIAKRIDSGAVHINGMTVHDNGPVPHGGVKHSGWGRFNSVEGLREFTTSSVITVNTPHKYI